MIDLPLDIYAALVLGGILLRNHPDEKQIRIRFRVPRAMAVSSPA